MSASLDKKEFLVAHSFATLDFKMHSAQNDAEHEFLELRDFYASDGLSWLD